MVTSAQAHHPTPSLLRLRTRRAQVVSVVSFMVLLCGATMLCYRQSAPLQVEPAATFGGVGWWLKPIEQSSVLRPPITNSQLGSIIFATPRSGWVVGNGGTILHTADGGGCRTALKSRNFAVRPHLLHLKRFFRTFGAG
jgi:hypothetical protein